MNKKIIGHIIAILSFLVGTVFVHQAFNGNHNFLRFFDLDIKRIVVFDIGFVVLGIAFFIEFFQSFKPLEYKKEDD